MDERIQHAKLLYESAVFAADEAALDTADSELDAVEADLALARGRIAHGRFLQRGTEYDPELFERALRLYRAADDLRGQAEALFWLGIFHQLVRRDDTTAVPSFSRSRELAAKSGDSLTLSYALRHLGIAEQRAGHLGTARDLLEESTRLRRELGFLPGVAANLVGLAYITAAEGDPGRALQVLDEADAIGAEGIRVHIEEARSALSPPAPAPTPPG